MPWRRLAIGLAVCLTLTAARAAPDTTRLQALLTEQRYAAARTDVEALLRAKKPGPAERALIYQWLFARDDGAGVERRTRHVLADAKADAVDLLAAGRLALDRRDFDRARLCFERALEQSTRPVDKAQALRGLGQRHYQLREFDASLQKLEQGLAAERTADGLSALADTLIRLGRTQDAIGAAEEAVALNRHHEAAHYLLGNGYAR
ncbi:MAG: tetratricopeptide repeat protein, partial [Rubrivivax sp.]